MCVLAIATLYGVLLLFWFAIPAAGLGAPAGCVVVVGCLLGFRFVVMVTLLGWFGFNSAPMLAICY